MKWNNAVKNRLVWNLKTCVFYFYFCRVFCSKDHYEQFKMKYGKCFKETCYWKEIYQNYWIRNIYRQLTKLEFNWKQNTFIIWKHFSYLKCIALLMYGLTFCYFLAHMNFPDKRGVNCPSVIYPFCCNYIFRPHNRSNFPTTFYTKHFHMSGLNIFFSNWRTFMWTFFTKQ